MKDIVKVQPEVWQTSVWDYSRPPKIENTTKHLKVVFESLVLAETRRAKKVLETSHPPVYYFPREDVQMACFKLNEEVSFCDYKGKASYYDLLLANTHIKDISWTYLSPTSNYTILKNYIAFFANKEVFCYIDEEKVTPQPGDFYGGWITKDIVGPFKGEEGTWEW